MDGRRQYRVTPDQGSRFHVAVLVSGRRAGEGVLFDASVGGVGVEFLSVDFPQANQPALAVGQQVDLRITSPTLAEPLELAASIVHRVDGDAGIRLGFRFENEAVLRRRDCPELFRLFNRRSSFRVEADPRAPVAVTLARGKHTIDAQLVDISAGGMAVLAPAEADAALESVDVLDATIALPGAAAPLEIPCHVRRRGVTGGAMQYGLEFDFDACGNARRARDVVMRYVMDRQRAVARRSAQAVRS